MMPGKLLIKHTPKMALSAASQTSLLVFHSAEPCSQRSPSTALLRFKTRAPLSSSLRIRSSLGYALKCGDRSFLTHSARKPGSIRVATDSETSPLIFESAVSESLEGELDLGGGGGNEGFGGGGGDDGDNNNNNNNNSGGGGGDQEGEVNPEKKMSMSQKLTLGYAALVGVGGLMGYIKSGSQKSLVSGGLSALLLYFVYTQLPTRPALASSLGLGLSAALLAVMGSRFKNSGKIFPAGVVSLVSLVMAGGYFHGILRGMHA